MTVKIANSETTINRILIEKLVDKSLPTLVVMVGIHGNEVTGFYALKSIEKTIKEKKLSFKANLYVIAGNLNAISKGNRYDTVDLNRLWADKQLKRINDSQTNFNSDEKEQIEIYAILKNILKDHTGKFYFVDLHTTSAPTSPYLVFSDSINNRQFSKFFPVPIVFGIEEYIQGPLLTYINEFGHVGVGFEAGSHNDKNAILINEAFLWIALAETGCLEKKDIPNYGFYVKKLKELSNFSNKLFEIVDKHSIYKGEKFSMLKGFDNFQKIIKNQALATSNSKTLYSPLNAQIFMPLYQKQGEDGYFIIKRVSSLWLSVSRLVRKYKLYNILKLLPNVSFIDSEKYFIKIKKESICSITEYFFHLFGYRQKTEKEAYTIYSRRDRKVKQLG